MNNSICWRIDYLRVLYVVTSINSCCIDHIDYVDCIAMRNVNVSCISEFVTNCVVTVLFEYHVPKNILVVRNSQEYF